ncbi:hypothetical protein LCGC14_3094950 [marine sediment metagenome]|uniref:Uncharacterized protein n=1 Tax=marine sediment metagenome TaxID=412755 RepID=A0A0F8YGY4_9ZZZZ
MFVVVDRKDQVVRVSGLTVTEASWLGYRFVQYNPSWAGRGRHGWCVVAFDMVPTKYSRAETYDISSDWSTAALRVAEIIKNPPPPVHDCPNCKCTPEHCK